MSNPSGLFGSISLYNSWDALLWKLNNVIRKVIYVKEMQSGKNSYIP